MAQTITSVLEILDGAQIRNKLAESLKSGQTAFATNDLRLRDKGEIDTKYTVAYDSTHSTFPTNRLPAHGGYFPVVVYKFGSTPQAAVTGTQGNYIFYDPTFDGIGESRVSEGSTLYSSYSSPSVNTKASIGYYMKVGENNYCWYISDTTGVISSQEYYTPVVVEDTYGYCFYNSSPSYSVPTAVTSLNNSAGWATILGTIYQNSSGHKWYDSYNAGAGTWGSLVTGLYLKEETVIPVAGTILTYTYKSITTGAATVGYGYKVVSISKTYNSSIGSSQTDILVSVSSTVHWQAQITSGGAYASIISSNTGDGNGSFTIRVVANSGASRTVGFSITDRLPVAKFSASTGTITQAAYISYTTVPYYGFLAASSMTFDPPTNMQACYTSGTVGNLYLSGGVYYANTSLTVYAPSGMYMTHKGTDGYPFYSDSDFVTI